MDADVDLEQLARGTPGFSGAELFNLVNTAALKASVDGLKAVTMHSLEYAKDKIMMGAERKSAIISPETLKLTAFHEAGHALVALKTKGADPIHKATIMPRGRALGMVMQLPDGDQTSMSRQQMLARLDVCMGGRVAEEVIFGPDNVTSGASSDIQQATRLARAMVTKYGLSNKVGIQFFDEKQHLSPHQQEEIDHEVKILLEQSYERAKKLLQDHAKELELLATGLMEYESLSGSEVVDLIHGRKISQLKRSQKPSRALQTLSPLSETVGTKEEKEKVKEKDKPVEHLANEKSNNTNNNSLNQSAPVTPANQTASKAETSNASPSPAPQTTTQPKTATRGPPK
jgi:ATP-dependent metalloprotease